MKTLKLNHMEKSRLSEKEMQLLTGGVGSCGCGCVYAEQGGSSKTDNSNANYDGNLHSPGMIEHNIFVPGVGWRVYWAYP